MKTQTLTILLTLAVVGCGGGSSKTSSSSTVTPPATAQREVIVTAGADVVEPDAAAVTSGVDLQRLNVGSVSAIYELSTPADEPFSFNVFTREQGNSGGVRVSVAHAQANGQTPQIDSSVESLSAVGIRANGAGLEGRDPWIDSAGDGFARVTISGAISEEQVIAVQSVNQRGVDTVLVRLRIGPLSPISVERQDPSTAPFVEASATLYSSDSWRFGLPTVATSGDRTTIVVYEGDEGDSFSPNRYEMRLQYDDASGAVTGGASTETGPDAGNWRDHEIAALFNVLALVRSGDQDLTIRLSYDRGATFAQDLVLERGAGFNSRLVQIAMAADYTLAVLFWRTVGDFRSELVLIEGQPSKTDASGSPTEFSFSSPVTLRTTDRDATPVIMGAQYSSGGDLVVGYAYTEVSDAPPPNNGNGLPARGVRTYYQCAVRLFGEATFSDTTVDDVITWSYDPSVALRGSGSSLAILYGYETDEGVRLKRSADAGQTFGPALALGNGSAHMPTVLLRDQGGAQRLDVVYLQRAEFGNELHVAHWDDYAPGRSPAIHRLTTALRTPGTATTNETTTSVAWLGYDATIEGDDVVVVYHEETYDFLRCVPMPAVRALGAPTAGGAQASAANFTPATPPPLAPGLTQAMPAPSAADRSQLKWIRLD